MLMLSPITIPAFQKAFELNLKQWRAAIAVIVAAGAFVQIVGVSVFVTTNEWYYNQHNIYEDRAFIFTPSASPVWVQFRDLIARRNIIPWAVRAATHPGAPLVLLSFLILTIAVGIYVLKIPRNATSGSDLPNVAMLTMASLVVFGFARTAPVLEPKEARLANYLNAGLSAQRNNRDIAAEELYALVLGLDPMNKFALHNLALLYEKTGQPAEAVALYQRAVASDSSFMPSVQNLTRYGIQAPAPGSVADQFCVTAEQCYGIGKRYWDSGSKQEALWIWHKASEQFGTQAWLIRNVARARYELSDFEGAVRDYRAALALSPQDSSIRADLAWALLNASQFDEARQICRDLLAADSQDKAALAILARLPRSDSIK
jgi:tetratricopeptide (TPR) repeat protein